MDVAMQQQRNVELAKRDKGLCFSGKGRDSKKELDDKK